MVLRTQTGPTRTSGRTPRPALRGAAGLLVTTALGAALTWALARRAAVVGRSVAEHVSALPPFGLPVVRVEHLLELAAVLVGVGVAGWFTTGLAVASACASARAAGASWSAGERLVARAAPVVVRRVLAVCLGTGVTLAGITLPAVATAEPPPDDLGWSSTVTDAGQPPSPSAPSPAVPTPDLPRPDDDAAPDGTSAGAAHAGSATGTPSPAPPTAGPATGGPSVPAPVAPPAGEPLDAAPAAPPAGEPPDAAPSPPAASSVTVRRGDTLWDIAAAHLPPGATTAEVAAAWPDWYRANLAVVGGDPDVIRPGQRLDPPTAGAAAATSTGATS